MARRQRGFTYLWLLLFVAVAGVGLAAVGTVWHTAQMREKERELLFVGNQFRQAIRLYFENTPGGVGRYPRNLEQLLRDDRHPVPRRYLRRIYRDPMTGEAEWGLATAPDGAVMGVHSLSEAPPIKTANFAAADRGFEGKSKYSEWRFVYLPPGAPQARPDPPAP